MQKMRFYVSRRVALALMLIFGALLPFLFVRIAFLILESATTSSSLDCIHWRLYNRNNTSRRLRDELTRVFIEASRGDVITGGELGSFNNLVKEATFEKHDLNTFALKTREVLSKLERHLNSLRQQEAIYWHLASGGISKSLHCLSLVLAEEYTVNSKARSLLLIPEFFSRLSDPSYHHIVLLTDNILAASVVVSSILRSSVNQNKLVLHIITDKKTYAPMHAWFALNSVNSAVLEVKGLHQFDLSREVNDRVKEIIDIHRLTWFHYHHNLIYDDIRYGEYRQKTLDIPWRNSVALINHLCIYLPELKQLFPELNRAVLLDDDTVVQHDLSPLWEIDLNGKVNGAVLTSCRNYCSPKRKYKHYMNFSNPIISSNFTADHSGWLSGMNVLDLKAWRKTNITKIYHQWNKLNLDSGGILWHPGALPPRLIAFHGYVHPLSCSWHVSGLASSPQVKQEVIENASVLHFSGPTKPWLDIGFPEERDLWYKHVNFSNEFVRKCGIMR